MGIFKTQWIVLQVGKYSEKELFYKIFFRDYGVLTVKKKKKVREKPIDIWYLISCEIITSNTKNIHTLWNIKITTFFQTENTPYKNIELFLRLLWNIKKQLPEWSPAYDLYDILSLYLKSSDPLSIQKLILTHLKIIACMWNLWETHSDETSRKILKFIHTRSYNDILRLWKIPRETQKHLEYLI